MFRIKTRFGLALLIIIFISGLSDTINTAPQNPEIQKSDKIIKQETDNYLINVKYPIVAHQKINRAIEQLIQKTVSDFKRQIGPKRVSSAWKNELWITYTISRCSDSIGSIRFDIYTFTGGAHGNTQVVTKTYDFKTGKALALTEIFNPKTNYLVRISELVCPIITKKMQTPKSDWINTGTAPTAENYQAFMLTEKSIIFIFQQYQVGPRVEGIPEVELKFEQVKDILPPAVTSGIKLKNQRT